MNNQKQTDEQILRHLFEDFVDAGLHGRFEEAFSFVDEQYIGVGMGNQGIVYSRDQANKVLSDAYRPSGGTLIENKTEKLTIHFLSDDIAVLVGQITITNTPKNGEPLYGGFTQTIGVRRTQDRWCIVFSHASPAEMTLENVEAYPLHFMDGTHALVKSDMHVEPILSAQINLTKNTVTRLECRINQLREKGGLYTLEDVVQCGLFGSTEPAVVQEYVAFWGRLRLLSLFAEGVTSDRFDYTMHTADEAVQLKSVVEMSRHPCSGDVLAVITYTKLDNRTSDYDRYSHRAFYDSLTEVLNRAGFESRAGEILSNYNPKNTTALFMIDLDDFKQINDRLGHQTGDTVLRQVAGVLENAFRSGDVVGRMGGDEFMVLVSGDLSAGYLEKKADELLKSVKLQLGGDKQIPVSVSIGIAYGKAHTTFEKLYHIADIAMYSAKKAGKCRYHLINVDTNAEYGYEGGSATLLSLQDLLDYTGTEGLWQSKTPYEALLENIPGGVVVLEFSGADAVKVTHCNDWLGKLLDRPNEEIASRQAENLFVFVHPEDISLLTNLFTQIRQGLDSFNIIFRIRHKGGHYKHIALAASTTERRRDCIIMYGIDTDVGEAVQLRQEVEKAHSNLQTLINTIPGGVLIVSLAKRVRLIHCNNWVARFLGYDVDDITAMENNNPFSLLHPDDLPLVRDTLRKMHSGQESVCVIYRLLSKDGTYRRVRMCASLTERRSDESAYYGIVTNVEEYANIQAGLESPDLNG